MLWMIVDSEDQDNLFHKIVKAPGIRKDISSLKIRPTEPHINNSFLPNSEEP